MKTYNNCITKPKSKVVRAHLTSTNKDRNGVIGVTITKDICDFFKITKGDSFLEYVQGNKIIMERVVGAHAHC